MLGSPYKKKITEVPFLSKNMGNLVWHAQYWAVPCGFQ